MGFFKPEDFEGTYNHYQPEMLQRYADLANAKLEHEGVIVEGDKYTDTDNCKNGWQVSYGLTSKTHKAILINIETIEKCKHEKVKAQYVTTDDLDNQVVFYKCECGAKVRPTSFEEIK